MMWCGWTTMLLLRLPMFIHVHGSDGQPSPRSVFYHGKSDENLHRLMKPSSGLVQKSGMDCAKKKCPLKRGLNNDQPENMGTRFPANPSENRNVISHFSKNCIFIGVPSSWIMIIPSIVGSIIPKLIIGQQQFIYPLWLLALPDEFGSKDGGVADILGCHWMVSVPISLGNFNSEKW